MPFAIVSYDISNNRRRNKVAKYLLDYGQRVQYSVFEVFEDREVLEQIFKRLQDFIQPDEDSLRMYILCKSCRKDITTAGKEKLYELDERYYIV